MAKKTPLRLLAFGLAALAILGGTLWTFDGIHFLNGASALAAGIGFAALSPGGFEVRTIGHA